MLSPVLVTAPSSLPVSLAEAKAHLRVDHSDDDDLIEGLVAAAVSHFDGRTGILGRALEAQTWEMVLDAFPASIVLPLEPVVSVTSVTFADADGADQVIAVEGYTLRGATISPVAGWPVTTGSIRIRWVAGTGCPPAMRHAIKLLVGHWYVHREAAGEAREELPLGIRALVAPWRRVGM